MDKVGSPGASFVGGGARRGNLEPTTACQRPNGPRRPAAASSAMGGPAQAGYSRMAGVVGAIDPALEGADLMATPQAAEYSARTPDRVAAALAGGFVVLLVATELVLSLPDQTASAADVAAFYAAHRSFIITLQVLGFGAAVLLGGYAWRLRRVDRAVSAAGMVV